jgi:chemotaxis protein MotB
VEIEGRKLTVRMPASRAFIPGGSELLPSALPTIDMIVGELRVLNHPIRIEGHTDSTRSSTLSNWDLSALRASTVVRYIESTGQLDHNQLSLGAYSDTRRRDLNENEEAHDKNRRVEFVVDL